MKPVTRESTPIDLGRLARPSGAFAMLAVDQRESLRAMFAEHQDEPVPDRTLTEFKLAATGILSPDASAVLLDKQFAFDQAVAAGAVAPSCGLIAAADRFVAGDGEIVSAVAIDGDVEPEVVRRQGAAAMKLLVIHRPDEPAAERIGMVEQFVDRCRRGGLLSIIEPVARAPRGGGAWDRDAGILAAARELGARGADLYKAEVPLGGRGPDEAILDACAALTDAIASPWVVLSSGVQAERFPAAVELACRAGASGFLAGRAVWAAVVGSDDIERDLRQVAVPRLRRLADLVDEVVRR